MRPLDFIDWKAQDLASHGIKAELRDESGAQTRITVITGHQYEVVETVGAITGHYDYLDDRGILHLEAPNGSPVMININHLVSMEGLR